MKNVLIYRNRKIDDMVFDASTPELENAAFLKLFKELDGYWQVYTDLKGEQKTLYKQAKDGNAEAAKKLLHLRKDHEYEQWHITKVE